MGQSDFLTHGEIILKELTDIDKKTGADVNAGLLVVKPDKKEYNAMIKEITSPAKNWIGPNKIHKGFYTFDFSVQVEDLYKKIHIVIQNKII